MGAAGNAGMFHHPQPRPRQVRRDYSFQGGKERGLKPASVAAMTQPQSPARRGGPFADIGCDIDSPYAVWVRTFVSTRSLSITAIPGVASGSTPRPRPSYRLNNRLHPELQGVRHPAYACGPDRRGRGRAARCGQAHVVSLASRPRAYGFFATLRPPRRPITNPARRFLRGGAPPMSCTTPAQAGGAVHPPSTGLDASRGQNRSGRDARDGLAGLRPLGQHLRRLRTCWPGSTRCSSTCRLRHALLHLPDQCLRHGSGVARQGSTSYVLDLPTRSTPRSCRARCSSPDLVSFLTYLRAAGAPRHDVCRAGRPVQMPRISSAPSCT